MKITITGIDKAELLAALYNNARPVGMGVLHYDPSNMTAEEAAKVIETSRKEKLMPGFIDYLKGRPIKVNILMDEIDPFGYDRDYGRGALLRIVNSLRNQ